MTVIVYHHEEQVIATDSRTSERSENMVVTDSAEKLSFIGPLPYWFTGSTLHINAYLIWSATEKPREPLPDSIQLEFLTIHNGQVYYGKVEKGNALAEPLQHSYAIGSGKQWAIAAMDHSATAFEAAKYAKTKDTLCGGQIHIYSVSGHGWKRRKQ
ncbi:hypothetical protein [Pseudoalteromonas rubra]|uniref:hypothetical protein n=1 Tax=Pseudoalteromonas rubra TaxID=43658 RepID=UPI002DBECD4D|nr:hypothetical protein [Pseudoalteromonas rubra]MEC4091601.1 hypothetical protein [Pseudoalteromonas rubra]